MPYRNSPNCRLCRGAPIAFQTLLFGFTVWKFVVALKSGWGNIPIMRLLVRDGTWAFILLFGTYRTVPRLLPTNVSYFFHHSDSC